MEGEFVLVTVDDLTARKNLSLRWRGPRRDNKALNKFDYQFKDLRTGLAEGVHVSLLKRFHKPSLNSEFIMSHMVPSETGMPVKRLMYLVE